MKELLEKYKEGRLSNPNEQDEFVNQLLEIRAARAAKKDGKVVDIKQQASKPSMSIVWVKRLAIAAALLLGGVLVWQMGEQDLNYTAEIQTYSKGLDFEVRGAATIPQSSDIDQALLQSYQVADYEAITAKLENQANPSQAQLMMLGVAFANLKTPDFAKALNCLNLINEAEYLQKATLLKALCQIELKQNDNAKQTLQQIISDKKFGNDDKAKAKKWLEDM